MDEEPIYNAIILALIIGIIIVVITLIIARPEKESFTELYFEDHTNLPRYVDNEFSFKFTIANHENTDYKYTYNILVEDQLIEESIITIANNQKETVTKKINLPVDDKLKIQVELPDKNQEIHFFVHNKNIYAPYEYLGNGIITCLPKFESGLLEFVMEGTEAQGNPQLEIRVNGTVINTLDISQRQIYSLDITRNSYVDITFINDAYIASNDTIFDRNIIVHSFLVNDQNVKPIYDRGKDEKAYDCKDLLQPERMAWNGALRFKT